MPVPILTFSELLVISAWLSAGHVLGCLIDHLPEYDSSRLTLLTSDPKNRVNLLGILREQQETGILASLRQIRRKMLLAGDTAVL